MFPSCYSIRKALTDILLAADVARFMDICVSYNEIENAKQLLEAL